MGEEISCHILHEKISCEVLFPRFSCETCPRPDRRTGLHNLKMVPAVAGTDLDSRLKTAGMTTLNTGLFTQRRFSIPLQYILRQSLKIVLKPILDHRKYGLV